MILPISHSHSGIDVVEVFTDGACLGNPGPGGWAAILIWRGTSKELSGGYRNTTNNRMELLAAIEALNSFKRSCTVVLYTDSRYICDAIEKGWLERWQRTDWKTVNKTTVKNRDLWTRLSYLLTRHTVRFHWVRGHSGHSQNERCDVLARTAAQASGLPRDEGAEY
ncbi:ribonuclease HI [Desulfovibrionales bacterium]